LVILLCAAITAPRLRVVTRQVKSGNRKKLIHLYSTTKTLLKKIENKNRSSAVDNNSG